MEKIKIVRVIARLNVGGPAIQAMLLSDHFNKDGYKTVLVTGSLSSGEEDMAYLSQGRDIDIRFLPELKRDPCFRDDLAALWKLFLLLKREKPDILHTHTAKAGTLGRAAGILYNLTSPGRRCRLFHTFHGHVFHGYFNRVKTFIFICIERILACFSDVLIAVSRRVKEDLIRYGIAAEGKIAVVRLGFDLGSFLTNPLPGLQERFRVGIVGRLVPIKNHRLFLQAALKVKEALPPGKVEFLIYGDGEERRSLEKLSAELGISGSVSFMGWQRDLPAVYRGLDVVVITSLNEGTPVSLIEAMASARAVVSTNAGGVADLLSDSSSIDLSGPFLLCRRGILVKSGDVYGLKEAVLFLMNNRADYLRLCENGRQYAGENFTKEKLVDNLKILYNSRL